MIRLLDMMVAIFAIGEFKGHLCRCMAVHDSVAGHGGDTSLLFCCARIDVV